GLRVKDSNALGGKTMFADAVSTDLGNNRNWNFGAQTLYWVAPSAGNWSDPLNWSYSSAGPGGAGVPDSDDAVVFDGGSVQNSTVDTSFAGSIASMTFTS